MSKRQITKMLVDLAMTILLLLLMAFELIGRENHEWLGAGIFCVFILHHILNWKWYENLGKGRYTAFRIVQTLLVFLVLLTMTGSMISGIILSRYVFVFLPIRGGSSLARSLHMVCGYSGFVLMSLHLGFHWNMVTGRIRNLFQSSHENSGNLRQRLRYLGMIIAVYGCYAFFKRDIGLYILLLNPFVYFDLDEPLLLFLLDYTAVMGLFIWIGNDSGNILKKADAHFWNIKEQQLNLHKEREEI